MVHLYYLMSCDIYTPSAPLDIESYRLPADATTLPANPKRLPRHRRGERFLLGPIPLAWLCPACRLRGKALTVAMALWFQAGLQGGSPTVVLTRSLLRQFGVTDRHAGYRALKALEAADLVEVERHTGRCPRVTIRNAGD
jgi:hypothetical protein